MPIAMFKAKTEPVQAIQYTKESTESIKVFLGDPKGWNLDVTSNRIRIFTPKGTHKADFGDWIVKGKDGFFSVKRDDFPKMYEDLNPPPVTPNKTTTTPPKA